jgi:hypothetical protein
MSRAMIKSVTDLGWSLWGELGVPSVVRKHTEVAIDPEPLIVFSRTLFSGDARLQEQVMRWCRAQADRVSASRLHGLQKAVSPEVAKGFGELADELRSVGVPWSGAPRATRMSEAKALELPTMRPALVRLRFRAVCGVGARADVLAELLARQGQWLVASDIDQLGYAKRSIARILAELADAGMATARAERNTVSYELARPERWQELLGAQGLVSVDWLSVFELAAVALRLDGESKKSESVRRVFAAKAAKQINQLAAVLHLSPLPPITGRQDAWDIVTAWMELQMRALADGTSSAFRRTPRGATRTVTGERSTPHRKRPSKR